MCEKINNRLEQIENRFQFIFEKMTVIKKEWLLQRKLKNKNLVIKRDQEDNTANL